MLLAWCCSWSMRCVMDGSMHSARWLCSWFPDGNAVWQCRQVVRVLASVDGIRLCCMMVSCLSVTLWGSRTARILLRNGGKYVGVRAAAGVFPALACELPCYVCGRLYGHVCGWVCVLLSSGVCVVCVQLLMCWS